MTPQNSALTITDFIKEACDPANSNQALKLSLGRLTDGVFVLASENLKQLREHYYNDETFACNAQDEVGEPQDKPCAFCSASRLRDNFKVRHRLFALVHDVTAGCFSVLNWNVTERRSVNKDGTRSAHQLMTSVFAEGVPGRPFLAHQRKFNFLLEFPSLKLEPGEIEEAINNFDMSIWEKFNPEQYRTKESNEVLLLEIPELRHCGALLK